MVYLEFLHEIKMWSEEDLVLHVLKINCRIGLQLAIGIKSKIFCYIWFSKHRPSWLCRNFINGFCRTFSIGTCISYSQVIYYLEGMYIINLTGAVFPHFIVLMYAMLLCFAAAVKLWMLFSVFWADSSIAGVQLSSSRNTQREQDNRGGSRGLMLRGNERDRFRSSGDWKSQWNCLYWEYLACFLLGLIYYDKASASRWIIEELRRKLPQDDELCPQSGDIVWEQFLLCSPAQDPVVFLPGILLEWVVLPKRKS